MAAARGRECAGDSVLGPQARRGLLPGHSRRRYRTAVPNQSLDRYDTDAEAFQRGYYENLVDVGKFNSELAARYQQMPQDFVRSLGRLGLARPTRDEQDYELVPSKEGRFIGAMVRTNHWGMRDREYTKERLPGTIRIALLGPSTAMASGVEADQGFEALLEERLNRESRTGIRYEVLNFGVAGYTPVHAMFQLERKVVAFHPDVVLFLAHVSDIAQTARQLTKLIRDGERTQRAHRVDEKGMRAVEGIDETFAVPDFGPTRRLHRARDFEREFVEGALVFTIGQAAFPNEAE